MNPQPRFREKMSRIQLKPSSFVPFLLFSFRSSPSSPSPPFLLAPGLLLLLSLPTSALPTLSPRLSHCSLPSSSPSSFLFFPFRPSLAFFFSPVFFVSASGSVIHSFSCTVSRVGTQYLLELPLLQTLGDRSLGPRVPQLEALGAPADASERSRPACCLQGKGFLLSDTTTSQSVQLLLTEETAMA